MKLVLASGSPRRAHLLRQLGLRFDVQPADLDETRHPGEPPGVYVERLARAKAEATVTDRLVLAADTAVVFDGQVLGKPGHPSEARSMLENLSGASHDVFTGVAVRLGNETVSAVDVTEVDMMAMTDTEITDYVDSGEPMDKAGAYALQGAGARFVNSVKGSPFTVIGLPVHLLTRMIEKVGLHIDDFKATSAV